MSPPESFSWTESGAIEDDQFNDFEIDIPYPDDDVLRAVERATIRIDLLDHAFAGDLEISIESPSEGFVELVRRCNGYRHASELDARRVRPVATYAAKAFQDRRLVQLRRSSAAE